MKVDLYNIQREAEQVVEMRRLNPKLYVPYHAEPESDLALVRIARAAVALVRANDEEHKQKLLWLTSELHNAELLSPDDA